MSFESVLKMKRIFQKNIFIQSLVVLSMVCLLMLGVSFVEQKGFREKEAYLNADGACPGYYYYIEPGDFCIERDLHDAGELSWEDAAMACMMDDTARLCTAAEWAQACDDGSISDEGEQWEWVSDFSEGNQVLKMGETSCTDIDQDQPFNAGQTEEFRCCKNAST